MNEIILKERKTGLLSALKESTTFKMIGSGFIYMKVNVEALTVRSVKAKDAEEDPKPIRVLVPEGNTIVLCLNTGKAQFLKSDEEVQIVDLKIEEVWLDNNS